MKFFSINWIPLEIPNVPATSPAPPPIIRGPHDPQVAVFPPPEADPGVALMQIRAEAVCEALVERVVVATEGWGGGGARSAQGGHKELQTKASQADVRKEKQVRKEAEMAEAASEGCGGAAVVVVSSRRG